jgi:hypothetical protein
MAADDTGKRCVARAKEDQNYVGTRVFHKSSSSQKCVATVVIIGRSRVREMESLGTAQVGTAQVEAREGAAQTSVTWHDAL